MTKTLPRLNKSPLWQRFKWIADPVGYMDIAAQQCPDIFTADIVGNQTKYVFVHHPEALQQMLTGDRHKFDASGKANELLKPLLGDYSIVMLEGDRHKERRKLLLPPFHGARMQAYGELIVNLTKNIFDRFTSGNTFTARTITQEISLQVILEAVYGLGNEASSQELKQRIVGMADVFNSPLTSAFLFFTWLQKDLGAWSPWGNFLRQQGAIDRAIAQELDRRQNEPDKERQDILSLLMSARDEDGQPMSDRELRDELMTLMFAGHETTATAMAWGLYWIHRNPQIKAQLLAEIAELGKKPDPMEIFKLPYLNAVCQETLRIYPVGMLTFPRIVKEPMELLGYSLEPGQILTGCIYLTHHREDIYPEAKQFKPERFLEKQYSPSEFITFGGGARRCIGEALAQFELKLVLATILANYDLSLVSDRPEQPQRRGVTLAPANGVQMIFQGDRKERLSVNSKQLSVTVDRS
jgi:cytochrome P450